MSAANCTRIRGEHLTNVREYLAGVRLKWDASRGYSAEFAREHDEVIRNAVESPERVVVVVTGPDDICNCGVCPRKRPSCEAPELLQKDKRVAAEHGVVIGKEYTSKELLHLLSKKDIVKGGPA
jgi:hypothetical protein